jgi:O-antigen ligase
MKGSRVAAAGLVLALAAILLHAQGFGYDEVRRPVVVLGAALALAAGAFAIRANTTPKPPQGGEGGRWLLRFSDLALLALAVSALFAVNRTEAVAVLFPAVAAWIFLRATALGWISREFLDRWALVLPSAIGLLFSGYGLCQYVGADFLAIGRGREAVSTLGNTNYAGVLSAVLAIAGLAAAFFERGLRGRFFGAGAALLGALHVAASGSLAGLLGLGAGVAAFVILMLRRHGWKPVALIPLAILVAAAAPSAKRVTTRISDIAHGKDRTANVRLGLWKGTLRLAAAHPVLGCGTGNFRMEFPPYRDADERKLSHEGRGVSYVEAEDPHNSYLAVLSESGPVALIAVLAALVLSVTSGFRRAREPDAGLAIAGAAGLIALAVSGLFNSLTGHLPFAVVAGLLAGVAAPVAPGLAPAPSPRMRVAWIAGAALLAIATLPWFVADIRYRDAMHTSRPEERVGYAQGAVSALPGHWQARFQIARSWRELGENEGTVRAELREVLKVHPHNVTAMVELSSSLPAAEEEEILRRAEKVAPEFVLVQTRLAGADFRRRDYAEARRRMEKILETLPEDPEALYFIGRMWLWERKPEEAIPWLRRAIAKNPKVRERLADQHPELKGDLRFAELLGP